MTVIQVLRPHPHGMRPFNWVHIEDQDHPGQPLCGNAMGYLLISEEIEEKGALICSPCRHARNHYSVAEAYNGQYQPYGDRNYIYKVIDLADVSRSESEVLAYCQAHVRKSFPHDEMPNWASPELVEFSGSKGVYRYHVREAYTG